MQSNSNMSELTKERSALLAFLWKNRKVLVIITGVAFVVSVVVSLLLTPLYLSTAVVFPTASSKVVGEVVPMPTLPVVGNVLVCANVVIE